MAEREAFLLEKAFSEAFAEYVREVKNTLELLTSGGELTGTNLEAFNRQQAVEREAFDKYRKARRAYFAFIQRAGGLALVMAADFCRTLQSQSTLLW